MCGYSFSVHIPETFNASKSAYPLIIFLHGGLTTQEQHLRYLGKAFYASADDPYILVMPKKQEWDWNPNKLKDHVRNKNFYPVSTKPNTKTYICNEGYGLIKYKSDIFGFRNKEEN